MQNNRLLGLRRYFTFDIMHDVISFEVNHQNKFQNNVCKILTPTSTQNKWHVWILHNIKKQFSTVIEQDG